MSGANRNYIGFFRGTGALQTITECGFRPRKVKVTHLGDGSTVELVDGEGSVAADEAGLLTPADGSAKSFLAAGAGLAITDAGFTVGTSAACNEDGEAFRFEAQD